MATLKIGMDILFSENISLDSFVGHGGLFKTKGVGQQYMANALNTPIPVMKTAGEGGAFGMAVLAKYSHDGEGLPLADYLDGKVFKDSERSTLLPSESGVEGFNKYTERLKKIIELQKAAADLL